MRENLEGALGNIKTCFHNEIKAKFNMIFDKSVGGVLFKEVPSRITAIGLALSPVIMYNRVNRQRMNRQ